MITAQRGFFVAMVASLVAPVVCVEADGTPTGPFARLYHSEQPTFEVDQMFGGDIDDEESFLYGPVDIALDTDGHLYVLDEKAKVIKKFDAAGQHLLTFSRAGEGPGDLQRPTNIAISPQGNVVVYDWLLRRFSSFTPDGQFLELQEFNEMGSHRIGTVGIDSQGRVYASINVQDSRQPEAPIPFRLCRLQLDPYSETCIDSAAVAVTLTVSQGDAMMYTGLPGAPAFLWALTPKDALVVGTSIDGALRIHEAALQHVSRHEVRTPPEPYTEQDRDAFLARFANSPYAPLIRQKVKFPEHHPYFHRLFVDDEGFILLQVRQIEDGEALYEVRNPDGSYLTTIRLPSLSQSAILSQGMIYTVQLHEDADYAVFRYRARP